MYPLCRFEKVFPIPMDGIADCIPTLLSWYPAWILPLAYYDIDASLLSRQHDILAALAAYRFLLGIGIGAEHPAGSVAASEATSETKPGHREPDVIAEVPVVKKGNQENQCGRAVISTTSRRLWAVINICDNILVTIGKLFVVWDLDSSIS
jgi:hypothetical protein